MERVAHPQQVRVQRVDAREEDRDGRGDGEHRRRPAEMGGVFDVVRRHV